MIPGMKNGECLHSPSVAYAVFREMNLQLPFRLILFPIVVICLPNLLPESKVFLGGVDISEREKFGIDRRDLIPAYHRCLQAIEAIDTDPFVRELVENLDARVIDASIKPV